MSTKTYMDGYEAGHGDCTRDVKRAVQDFKASVSEARRNEDISPADRKRLAQWAADLEQRILLATRMGLV